MPKRKFLSLALSVALIVSFAGLLTADYKITQKTNTEGVMGQPPQEATQVTYISKDAVRSEMQGGMVSLYKADGNFYFLFPDKKEYMELDWDKMNQLMSMAQGMMGDMTVDVNSTSEKQKVGSWNTSIWKADLKSKMFTMQMTFYQTMDLDIPDTYRAFQKEMMKMQGPMKKMVEAFEKMDGFTVKMDMDMQVMGQNVKSTMNITSVEEKTFPASMFEIPGDYKKVEFDPMALNQGGGF